MLNRLINTLLALGLLAGFWGVWQLLDQPVETLRIKSDLSPGERQQVDRLLSGEALGGILSFDMEALRTRLKKMGWAREIEIRRQWPHSVEISLLREQPIARWGQDQFITASSQIMALPDEHSELPQIKAAISSPSQSLRVFRMLNQMLRPSELQIVQLEQNAHGEWQVVFQQGFVVRLGVGRLSERVNRLLSVYASNLRDDPRDIAYIDVRYASGAAVRFEQDDADPMLVAQHR